MTTEYLNLIKLIDGFPTFICPACEVPHRAPLESWNKSYDKPTIRPPLRIQNVNFSESSAFYGGVPEMARGMMCASIVIDGTIFFLNESTHHLSGKKLPLNPWPLKACKHGESE